MASLIEKIEADAAARLPLPPGRLPGEELPRYARFLKVADHRLRLHRRAGATGREICQAHAAMVDALLRYIWDAARASLSPQAQKEFPSMALVAVGGYGRAELNLQSDIDLMFLHAGQVVAASKPLPYLSKQMDTVLYTLWDLGFKTGHSVRTVADCVSAANDTNDAKSMETKTSLLEARLITGDRKLFTKCQRTFHARCIKRHEDAYIAARLADQALRRAKYGNSATMQEPNIKNGCGGLRDYQNLHWMAWVKYGIRSLSEIQDRGLLSAGERKQLEAAYDFLLVVRNEIHAEMKKPVDVLTRHLQPVVAWSLGYLDRSPARRIERFMRDLYVHMRNIHLITRTLEDRLALAPKASRLASIRDLLPERFRRRKAEVVVDGFKIIGEQLHAVSNRVFRDQPRRLMRVFLHAQQRGLRLHPDLAQLIRQDLPLVNREFLRDDHVHQTFLEILNQRGNVGRILRSMHEVGLLGRYLPEFGRLTCLVQHEFYHLYAADEHTLMCLEQLDRVWEGQSPQTSRYAEMLKQLERPFILYLALLLHDAGKALHTGHHSEIGGQMALEVAPRLRIDGATAHSLRLLIENHLVMAQTSQRRDLDDAKVIHHFASQIQTAENLRMLTLHTYVDSLATSDKLWNSFKDSLLWTLFSKALQVLEGGTDFIRAEVRQRELLSEEVSTLVPRSFGPEEVTAHFATLPPRYYQIHTPKEILGDLALVHRFMHQQMAEEEHALEPIVSWHNEPDRAYTSAKVCTWNRAGLFSKIAGSFAAAGLNILNAQIFSRNDGIVLDTFYVTDAHSGGLVGRSEREKFENILRKALAVEGYDLRAAFARQRPSLRTPYQTADTEGIPTRIFFDNDSSQERTVIDLETEDRVGVLYAISEVFSEVGLDIALAKISTEKGAAIDTFYVSEIPQGKILDLNRQRYIADRLRQSIGQLDAAPR